MKKTLWDIIILHMCTINENHMMYDYWTIHHKVTIQPYVWFLRYGVQHNFFSFWTIFCSFTPPPPPLNNPENQNFESMKEVLRDTIIIHKRTTNGNYMMYGSWDMKCDRQTSFWTIFCLFTWLKTQKIKFLKTWKRCLEISSFYSSVPKIMICYVPEIWHVTDVISIFHFGLFFTLLPY